MDFRALFTALEIEHPHRRWSCLQRRVEDSMPAAIKIWKPFEHEKLVTQPYTFKRRSAGKLCLQKLPPTPARVHANAFISIPIGSGITFFCAWTMFAPFPTPRHAGIKAFNAPTKTDVPTAMERFAFTLPIQPRLSTCSVDDAYPFYRATRFGAVGWKKWEKYKAFCSFFSSVPSLSRFASFWKQETGFKANQIGSTSDRMSFRDFTNEAELLLGSVSKRRNDRSLPEGFVPSLCRLKRERQKNGSVWNDFLRFDMLDCCTVAETNSNN